MFFQSFSNFFKVKTLYVPPFTALGDYWFFNCNTVKNVKLINGVFIIGQGSFTKCTNLQNINFPISLINIEDYAFSKCTNLQSITIPENI